MEVYQSRYSWAFCRVKSETSDGGVPSRDKKNTLLSPTVSRWFSSFPFSHFSTCPLLLLLPPDATFWELLLVFVQLHVSLLAVLLLFWLVTFHRVYALSLPLGMLLVSCHQRFSFISYLSTSNNKFIALRALVNPASPANVKFYSSKCKCCVLCVSILACLLRRIVHPAFPEHNVIAMPALSPT